MLESILIESFVLMAILSGAPLLVSSFVGVIVATVQAATQIQEPTVLYFAKFLSVCGILALFASWSARECSAFLIRVLESLVPLGAGSLW